MKRPYLCPASEQLEFELGSSCLIGGSITGNGENPDMPIENLDDDVWESMLNLL